MKLLNTLAFFLALVAHTSQSVPITTRKYLKGGDDAPTLKFTTTPESNGVIPPIAFDGSSSFIGAYVIENEYPGAVQITLSVTNQNPESCSVALVNNACNGAPVSVGQTCSFDVQVTPLVNAAGTSCTSKTEASSPVRGGHASDSFTVTAVTVAPSVSPTEMPSYQDTAAPSIAPSEMPSYQDTPMPTAVPSTDMPSSMPTADSTSTPSMEPTNNPTASPSVQSIAPTHAPSSAPSITPTDDNTAEPSTSPSFMPSQLPTSANQTSPSYAPTRMPTDKNDPDANDDANDDHHRKHTIYVISIVIPFSVIGCCLAAIGCSYYQKKQSYEQTQHDQDLSNSSVSECLLVRLDA